MAIGEELEVEVPTLKYAGKMVQLRVTMLAVEMELKVVMPPNVVVGGPMAVPLPAAMQRILRCKSNCPSERSSYDS